MKRRNILISICAAFLIVTVFIFAMSSVSVKAETLNDNYTDLKHIEKDDLYYTDSYFKQSAKIYNPHLATVTMAMANSTGPAGDPKNMEDEEWFKNQPKRFSGFLERLSFTDFDSNEDYKKATTFSTIGVGAAKREIGDDTTVVAIGVRSSGYFTEWANNMHLGTGKESDYMHEGWYNAANKLLKFLDSYVTNHVTTSKVKVWLTGFSRGGATANVAAGLIDNKLDKGEKLFQKDVKFTSDDLYAYTFEAPQGANVNSKTVKTPKDKIYNNIWNIVNPKDIVTKVAMSQYGFTRFGQDKYITNSFYDIDNYSSNRYTYRQFLNKLTTENVNPDDFVMYGLPLEFLAKGLANKILGGDFTILQVDPNKRNYDANIAETLLLEELTKNIGSREDYCKNIQSYLENVMYLLKGYNGPDKSKLKSNWPAMLCGFISGGVLYAVTGSTKHVTFAAEQWAKWLGMDDTFTKEVTKLATVLVAPVAKTYWEKPNELISVGKYISQIFDNHNTEVTRAHVQAQDTFYVNEYNKANPDKQQLKLVPFLDNADYGRMSFTGFNDCGLYDGDQRKINITGKVLGRSDVDNMGGRFAAGYYSYATEEKMEIFFPLGKYKITMKDFSKKPYHTMSYAAYRQYMCVNEKGATKKIVDSFEDWAIFISKRYVRKDINVNV